MGFSGRCEAIKAPTTENDTVQVGRTANEGPSQAKKISPGERPLRRARITLAAASATHTTHSDHASTVAPWVLLPPTTRSCFLGPSVTTPLYSTTVSQALRNALRGSLYEARRERTSENAQKAKFAEFFECELRRTPLWRSSQNS